MTVDEWIDGLKNELIVDEQMNECLYRWMGWMDVFLSG